MQVLLFVWAFTLFAWFALWQVAGLGTYGIEHYLITGV